MPKLKRKSRAAGAAPFSSEKGSSEKGAGFGPRAEIGIIGGSGLYAMPGLERARELRLRTPFGDPSDAFILGTLEGRRVAFLARHGRGHRLLPSEINYRANLYAMKMLGVERVLSVSAVGSLQEELRPLEFLVPDQFVDRTRRRISTFFGEGIVAHVGFDRPVCPELSALLGNACEEARVPVHARGTYVCIEGPQFSTLAEAHLHRQWHCEVVGMTNVTEAKLAREAELCYATLAMITDYDCWHPQHDSVTVAEIVANLNRNAENACAVIRAAVRHAPADRACRCGRALAHAILTDPARIPSAARRRLALLVGKYLK